VVEAAAFLQLACLVWPCSIQASIVAWLVDAGQVQWRGWFAFAVLTEAELVALVAIGELQFASALAVDDFAKMQPPVQDS